MEREVQALALSRLALKQPFFPCQFDSNKSFEKYIANTVILKTCYRHFLNGPNPDWRLWLQANGWPLFTLWALFTVLAVQNSLEVFVKCSIHLLCSK